LRGTPGSAHLPQSFNANENARELKTHCKAELDFKSGKVRPSRAIALSALCFFDFRVVLKLLLLI
jgi:hypothetical protein